MGLFEAIEKNIQDIVNIIKDIRKPALYSSKWFEQTSDAVLKVEREKVRIDYCQSGDDFTKACNLERLLGRFDKELSKRAWAGQEPKASSIRREHSWYLPNDD